MECTLCFSCFPINLPPTSRKKEWEERKTKKRKNEKMKKWKNEKMKKWKNRINYNQKNDKRTRKITMKLKKLIFLIEADSASSIFIFILMFIFIRFTVVSLIPNNLISHNVRSLVRTFWKYPNSLRIFFKIILSGDASPYV